MRSLIFILLSLPSLAFAHFTGQLYDHHHSNEIPYLNELLLSQQPSFEASPLEIFEPLTIEYDPNIAQMIQTMDVNVFHDIIKRLSGVLPLRDGEKPIENRFSRFEDIRRAGDWLAERFKSFGLAVRFHEYDPRTTFEEIASLYRHNPQFQPTLRKIKGVLEGNGSDKWRNVVASIPGVFPNKRIIVGAHYDSIVDWGKNPFQPGADDNASGTAALLLMAEAFMRAGITSTATIEFVAFSGEELGLFGSAAYAGDLKKAGVEIVGMINLDMIAFDTDKNFAFDIHSGGDNQSVYLSRLASAIPSTYNLLTVPQVLIKNAMSASDHSSFWRYKFPAIFLTEDYCSGKLDECQKSWFDFNTNLHSIYDTLEYMNLTYGIEMVRTTAGLLAQFAKETKF